MEAVSSGPLVGFRQRTADSTPSFVRSSNFERCSFGNPRRVDCSGRVPADDMRGDGSDHAPSPGFTGNQEPRRNTPGRENADALPNAL